MILSKNLKLAEIDLHLSLRRKQKTLKLKLMHIVHAGVLNLSAQKKANSLIMKKKLELHLKL
jgi:hypothetical protein